VPADALALVATAALVHALWNLLAKRAADQTALLLGASTIGGLLALPFLVVAAARGEVPAAGLVAALASAAIHAGYFALLGAGYRRGDLSVVYPVARGSAPLVVALLAGPVFGERLAPLGWAGVATIVAGLGLVAGTGIARAAGHPGEASAAVGLGLAVGLTIAAYSLVDRGGVALVPVPAYLALQLLGAGLLMAPAWLADSGRRARLVAFATDRRAVGTAMLCAAGILAAYGLVLTAMTRANVAYVVAGRELAIVFGTALGAVVLKERITPGRALGAAVIALGVGVLALA
jgi:drug/metabolite transporter (DMT)-like permease